MTERFKGYIDKQKLFLPLDGIIATVSGGVDSVVMLDLLIKSGFKRVVVAHCNFNLRGKESDGDETFVKELGEKYGLKVFVKSFDTQGFAKERGVSIQMAARELRYGWFEELRRELGYDYIAVAHNKDDVAETVILNMVRGTGLAGLGGIKPKNGKIVRPVLTFTREEILKYAAENNLTYREDSSNTSVKYKRNFVRHKVLPMLKELNPAVVDTLFGHTALYRGLAGLLNELAEEKIKQYLSKEAEADCIDKAVLSETGYPVELLYSFLEGFGFSYIDAENMKEAKTGAKFISPKGFVAYVGRERICVEAKSNGTNDKVYVWNSIDELPEDLPFKLKAEVITPQEVKFDKSGKTVYFDLEKIKFPLYFRKWRHGDFFYPLGMRGKKKISDFLIDKKVDIITKEKTFVLTDYENNILWVIPFRISDKYKISKNTKNVLKINI